jgi:hypothetical protein
MLFVDPDMFLEELRILETQPKPTNLVELLDFEEKMQRLRRIKEEILELQVKSHNEEWCILSKSEAPVASASLLSQNLMEELKEEGISSIDELNETISVLRTKLAPSNDDSSSTHAVNAVDKDKLKRLEKLKSRFMAPRVVGLDKNDLKPCLMTLIRCCTNANLDSLDVEIATYFQQLKKLEDECRISAPRYISLKEKAHRLSVVRDLYSVWENLPSFLNEENFSMNLLKPHIESLLQGEEQTLESDITMKNISSHIISIKKRIGMESQGTSATCLRMQVSLERLSAISEFIGVCSKVDTASFVESPPQTPVSKGDIPPMYSPSSDDDNNSQGFSSPSSTDSDDNRVVVEVLHAAEDIVSWLHLIPEDSAHRLLLELLLEVSKREAEWSNEPALILVEKLRKSMGEEDLVSKEMRDACESVCKSIKKSKRHEARTYVFHMLKILKPVDINDLMRRIHLSKESATVLRGKKNVIIVLGQR